MCSNGTCHGKHFSATHVIFLILLGINLVVGLLHVFGVL